MIKRYQKMNKLKEKLDPFDKMLNEGKISEDINKIRINRIENELKELEWNL